MLLDDLRSVDEIIIAMSDFQEPYIMEDLEADNVKIFWNAIEQLNPYCYFSYGIQERLTFVARGPDLHNQFLECLHPDDACVEYNGKSSHDFVLLVEASFLAHLGELT